jgi:CheY-like chemotaxis protein
MAAPHPTVLLVEDNEEDAFLLQRALRQERIDCDLHVVEDGEEAIEYLSGRGRFADRTLHPLPSVMLLDLKLPCLNGFDVLEWLATQPAFKDLRTFILTSSGEDRDREKAAQFGVRWYFVKPPSRDLIEEFTKVLRETCTAPAK